MSESFRNRFLHGATIFLLSVIVIGGAAMAYPKFIRSQNLRLQERELRAQIEAKTREIERLNDYQRRFRSDPDFVETIARQNKRVYPGELVFIFED